MSTVHYHALDHWYWKWIAIGVSTGIGLLLVRRRIAGAVCRCDTLLKGKTVIVTGANTGIGKATALEVARRYGRVIMACRDLKKGEAAKKEISSITPNGELVVRKLDLASLKSVREFARQICQEEICLHALVNNAGVMECPYQLTEDGLETHMAVNHFGHFLLTNLLLDKLKASIVSFFSETEIGLYSVHRYKVTYLGMYTLYT